MPGKKFRAAAEKVDRNKRYSIAEGFQVLKATTELVKGKFDQTIDGGINFRRLFRIGREPQRFQRQPNSIPRLPPP